ncbi:AAA family ATPase [Actinoplanes couchii]|uniref:ATP/GTP-binding protein n=1 Tax=Actinoplanes couchii TaxID=403638 RepID=A0ABQ3XL05_9ACTN|nr:ATP-binding protein [Actinoplanes couchii]MDR6319438.1 putative kinase [Actinoplanes couchii]GID59171.1 hypothetical protein Aco03nite_075750 [Actinoplanes couchii]
MPIAYLLVGLTGSGKTTYATRVLEPAGVVRLSVDERVFARHGRYGVDYPEHTYFEREAPVVAEVRAETVALLSAGRDVVVDYGLWRRSERDDWRALAEQAGAEVRLLYFPVGRDELLRRLTARNRETHANALPVTAEALDAFHARFDVPVGEGEQVVAAGSEWVRDRAAEFTALRGRRIVAWTGLEEALTEDGFRFEDPAVPCLQLAVLIAAFGDGTTIEVRTYQDEDLSGLLLSADTGNPYRSNPGIRERPLPELPTGVLSDVGTVLDQGQLAEVLLDVGGQPLLLVAGEVDLDGPRFVRLGACVLAFTDPATATTLEWSSPR